LQSASDLHESDLPLQSSSKHIDPVGQVCRLSAGQLPAPSQNAASVAMPFAQIASRHETPGPGYAHERVVVPSHAPPHGALPALVQPGRPSAGGLPSGMGVHLPIAFG
jgi:hypothetical protein